MKYYNTYKSYTGGYTTVEWSASEMFNYHMIIMVVLGYIASILSVFISGILIFVTIHDAEDEGIKPSLWGAVISGGILLDNHYEFIMTAFQRIFLGDETYAIVHALNLTYFVVHLFLIFLGPTLYHNIKKDSEKKGTLLIYTLIFGICFFIGTFDSPIHKPKFKISENNLEIVK